MQFTVQWQDSLPSTNAFLKERLGRDPDLPEGTVVVAREQTEGRGRRGSTWNSEGENLTFSILLRGLADPKTAPSAAMAAAIAVSELLEAEGLNPSLKWPNDVLIDGKKICGILSEGTSDGVILGIGLNVNMERSDHIDQPATSILIETGKHCSIDELLEKLLQHLSVWIEKWEKGGFSALRNDWEANVPDIGKPVTVRDADVEQNGLLTGFGDDGELLLRTESGDLISIWAGDLSV